MPQLVIKVSCDIPDTANSGNSDNCGITRCWLWCFCRLLRRLCLLRPSSLPSPTCNGDFWLAKWLAPYQPFAVYRRSLLFFNLFVVANVLARVLGVARMCFFCARFFCAFFSLFFHPKMSPQNDGI